MPKVSVIIPNYNHGCYLEQRLNSVLQQTYQDFEVIILDDCSTDNSKEIIEQYRRNNKVRSIVYNETNSGNPFKQWDKGIQLAAGEFVWIAESDDWCEISLLENLIEGIEQNEDCVVSYCQSYCISEEDNSIQFQSFSRKLAEIIDGKTFIKGSMLVDNRIFNAGMAIWRKAIYNKISKDFINYRLTGDYYFWIEVCNFGGVFVCGKALNYFRRHEKNVSFTSYNNGSTFIERLPVLKQLLNRRIIDKPDYFKALKKNYTLFRFCEKNIATEDLKVIRKLFYSSLKLRYQLNLYFEQKRIQQFLKKFLRV